MAGLVWNPPTSCAWAARVYVSNREARDHGRRCVGLPSSVAAFEGGGAPAQQSAPVVVVAPTTTPRARFARRRGAGAAAPPPKAPALPPRSWWEVTAPAAAPAAAPATTLGGAPLLSIRPKASASPSSSAPACTLALPPAPRDGAWAGPRLTLALPSFSGGTPACPALLKYACTLATRVRPLPPARVGFEGGDAEDASPLRRLLGGRPLLALQFGDMTMTVQEPERLVVKAERGYGRRRAALLV